MPPKRKRTSKAMANRISKLESLVGKTLENKVRDHTNGSLYTNIDTNGMRELAFFRNVLSGTEINDRIGDKVTLMSQTFRIQIQGPTLGNPASEQQNMIRLLIVENVDYTGGTDLQLSDVLEQSSFVAVGRQVFVSPYKSRGGTNARYRVHYDKTFSLNQTDGLYKVLKKRIKYGTKTNPGKVLEFGGPAESYPSNHRLVLFAISDSNVIPHPTIAWNCRNVFKDA